MESGHHNARNELLDKRVGFLKKYGAEVELDKPTVDAYRIKFRFGEGVVTLRIVLNDYSRADLVITNMTTSPDSQKNMKLGSEALQSVLLWATVSNFKEVRAVQVQKPSEGFWVKNGFVKCEGPNPTNDFAYQVPAA